MVKTNSLLPVSRLPEHLREYSEIKDPSVVALPNEQYMMFASIGDSRTQRWIVGRFIASHPAGPWQEISPVKFIGISGPQLCAPAVMYEQQNGQAKFTMYIQTACFEENGVIAVATSDDGETFSGVSASVITREKIDEEDKKKTNVVGVYDAGICEVTINGENRVVMLFSGYRRVGCGDIYMSWKKKDAPESEWTIGKRILAQEDVPFHNKPDYEAFEWGLEGAKIIQVSEKCFLMIGVCFLPLPNEYAGSRQRVFFAASTSIHGPFVPIGTPFQPQKYETNAGEHGHPDTLIIGNDLWIIYQERKGASAPWHLRYAVMDLTKFAHHAEESLQMFPLGIVNGIKLQSP